MKITFCCPHVRISGGVRAILTYADRLARRVHAVTVVVPAKCGLTAWWRTLRRVGPGWVQDFRASVLWVRKWSADRLPEGDAVVATAWQSARTAAEAHPGSGRSHPILNGLGQELAPGGRPP